MSASILALLAFGGLIAFFMVMRPRLLLWGLTLYTLIIIGLTGYFFPNAKIFNWVGYGAASLMFIYLLQKRGRARVVGGNEFFLKFSIYAFLVISLFSTVYALPPPFQVIAAAKSLFMFGGVWAFFSCVRFTDKAMLKWLKLLFFVGLIQWLPAIYQYLFVRSYRIEKGLGTVSSADSVVGTFGGSMESGGLTAVLAFYLVVMVVAATALKAERLIKTKKYLLMMAFLVGPLLLMEVKVIFFYLPVALVMLFRKALLKSPGRAIMGGAAAVLVLGVMLASYQYFHWSEGGGDLKTNLVESFAYSFKEEGGYAAEQSGALTRVGAITFWAQEHSGQNYLKALLGHGLGASRTEGQVLGSAAFKYYPKNIDRTGLAAMLWDVGVLGVLFLLAIVLGVFLRTTRLIRATQPGTWKRALARTLSAILPLIVMSLLYRKDIPFAGTMMFLVYSVFGLTAWLRKNSQIQQPVTNPGKAVEQST